MLYKRKLAAALEDCRDRLGAFDHAHVDDLVRYREALAFVAGLSGDELEDRLKGKESPGALPSEEFGHPPGILVPFGNSTEKNAAMRAFGARLIEFGRDFDEAKVEAARLADAEGLHMVPSYHPALVKGVASYALELFAAAGPLDAVYVPIGMGSGISGLIAARDALGLTTEIVGVVAEAAPAVALSFQARHPVATNTAATFADGMACREPHADALAVMLRGAADVVRVTEDEIADAIRLLYETTHNVAEGAGAAAIAALLKDRRRRPGARLGVILSGGNVDRPVLARILNGETPVV